MRNPTKANYKFVLRDWMGLRDLDALAGVLESKRFSQNLEPILMDRPDAKKILRKTL